MTDFEQRVPVDPDDLNSDASDVEDEAPLTAEDAGDMMVDFLLQLHYSGKLSAKSLSIICWFGAQAGARGSVKRFGLHPRAQSGHYQRHLDTATGVNLNTERKKRYLVPVPGHHKYDNSRALHDVMVNVPREVLNQELLSNPEIMASVPNME